MKGDIKTNFIIIRLRLTINHLPYLIPVYPLHPC